MKKKLIVVLLSLFIVFSAFSGGQKEKAKQSSAGPTTGPTVANAMGITTEFPQQLELAAFENRPARNLLYR